MQADAALTRLPLEVRILGVNQAGHESGNGVNCAGRSIPWLQDVLATNVWLLWQVTYRDVIILDDQNMLVSIYNLTSNDLQVPANYDTLRGLLVDAASAP